MCMCRCMYVCMYVCMHLSIYLSIYRSIYLSVCLSVCLSIYLSIHPSIDRSISISISISIYIYRYLSIYRSIDLSIYLSIYLSTSRMSFWNCQQYQRSGVCCYQTWLAGECPTYRCYSHEKNIKVLHFVLDFPLPCLITREFSLCPAKTRIKRPVRQPAATRAPVWSGHYGDLKSSTSYFFRL